MSHPRRAHIHEETTLGDRAADGLTNFVGSWRFVIAQNVVVLLWILFNVLAVFVWKWDPYPFILLNLVFSWQASNTGPVLQMAQNRQAVKDRKRDDVEAEEVDELFQINRTQLEILELLKELLNADTRRAPAQSTPPLERPKALVVPQKGRMPGTNA